MCQLEHIFAVQRHNQRISTSELPNANAQWGGRPAPIPSGGSRMRSRSMSLKCGDFQLQVYSLHALAVYPFEKQFSMLNDYIPCTIFNY